LALIKTILTMPIEFVYNEDGYKVFEFNDLRPLNSIIQCRIYVIPDRLEFMIENLDDLVDVFDPFGEEYEDIIEYSIYIDLREVNWYNGSIIIRSMSLVRNKSAKKY